MVEHGGTSGPHDANQPMLPGMDALTSDIAKLHKRARQTGIQALAQDVRNAAIVPVQAAIAEQYVEEVIEPREQIWNDTTAVLSVTEPLAIHYTSDNPPAATIIWQFDETVPTDGAEASVQITYYADSVVLGQRAKPDNPNELDTAARALSPSDYWNRPPERWERPDQTILGVPITYDAGQMTVDRGPLATEVGAEALELTEKLRLEVSADILDGSERKPVYRAEIAKADFAPLGENAARGDRHLTDVRYLRQQHLYMFEGLGGNEDALPGKAEEFLLRTFIEPGVGDDFAQFEATYQHLDVATPKVSEQREIVLKEKSWLRKKLEGS
jgi:hypothetical protein